MMDSSLASSLITLGWIPIQAHGLVSIQAAQQGSDCLLLGSWGSILLPMPVYHLRGLFVLTQPVLVLKTEARKVVSTSAFS